MTNAALKIARRLKRRKGYAGGGAPEAFPEDIRRVHIRSDAPVGEDQSALAGNVDYDTMTGLPITQPEQPPSDAASSSSFMDGTLGRALRRLTGTQFGEPRHQLWPEKMVRSGVSLAGDVLSGDQAVLPPGLRREDYTDIPAPTEPTADSTWLGRQMGWAPQAAQPNDPMMERAQDMAGLAGGQTLLTGAREAMPAAQRALVAAADSQATGAPLAALEHAAQAPRFYSGLERAVEAIPQPTMTGQQWLGTLTNRGVKAEEIQSDWHQAGRKQGYRARPLPPKAHARLQAERDTLFQKYLEDASIENADRLKALDDQLGANKDRTIPDAPFKKNWHELVLKDAIREAAEKGLDRISWTPGEAQAARYDLSKHFDEIRYEPGSQTLDGFKDGKRLMGKTVAPENLADNIGKDAAEKLLAAPLEKGGTKKDRHRITGLDLKVGGEGMKGFYDKMIPDALNKIGKKHGVKVEKGDAGARYSLVDNEGKPGPSFANKAEADRWMADNGDNPYWKMKTEGQPVHYMDIPQSLKDEVLQKGFSLFEDSATAGAPLAALEKSATQTPQFKKWFGDSKVVDENGQPLVTYKAMDTDTPNMQPDTGLTHVALDRSVAEQFSGGRKVNEVYVKSEKPFDFRNPEDLGWLSKEMAKPENVAAYNRDTQRLMGEGYTHEADARHIAAGLEEGLYQAYEVPAVSNLIKSKGYDGIMMTEDVNGPVNLAVFDPDQIKSATGNSGAFDPKNPSIMLEDASAMGAPLAALERSAPREGFKALDSSPQERALTVNDVLDPKTPAQKPRSRGVEEIAKDLMDRGAAALRELGVETGRIEGPNPRTDELVARSIASEAKAALQRGGKTASDWYTQKIAEAMDNAAEIHPELKNDPHQKMGFTTALAVTSQGETVTSNVRLADQVYDHFKKTGRFPTNVQAKTGPAMNSNFAKMNALLDELGPEGVREFLHKEFTVKELEQAGYDVGGENKQTKVYGSSILGPKIGQGFYQNLNGNYKPVTMDLLFMRGWGRLTGTLVGKTDMAKPTQRLVDAIRADGRKVPRDPGKLELIAEDLVKTHERDFKTNRALYNSGERKRSELSYAAERYLKNLKGINEQPTSGAQRVWMRSVVDRAREILEGEGHKVTNADLQAIWWYPEKELYSKLGGRDSEAINVDYASAFKDLANKMKGQNDAEKGPVRAAPRGRSADQADDAGAGKDRGGGGEEVDGPQVNPALEIARKVKRAKGGRVHVGPITGTTGGRADKRPMEVPDGAYVLTADHVSGLGEGNTDAGMKKLSAMFPASKPSALRQRAAGGATNVPIYAADGEFVIHPDDIVDRFGELEYGHRALDAWQTAERQELIKTLEQLDPPAQD